MICFTWDGPNKLGDSILTTHIPENFFRTYNAKCVDNTGLEAWRFNPYVVMNGEISITKSIWHSWQAENQSGRPHLTLAHMHCAALGLRCYLNKPRFYQFEGATKLFDSVAVNTSGSNKQMPQYVINHIRDKYHGFIFHLGGKKDLDLGCFDRRGDGFWSQMKILAECKLFIGLDTSLAHAAQAYDIRRKIVLPEISEKDLETWLPTGYYWKNVEYYNVHKYSIGITSSYTEI